MTCLKNKNVPIKLDAWDEKKLEKYLLTFQGNWKVDNRFHKRLGALIIPHLFVGIGWEKKEEALLKDYL